MIYKISRIIIAFLGGLLGFGTVNLLQLFKVVTLDNNGWFSLAVHLGVSVIFGIIFYILSPRIIDRTKKAVGFLENELQKIPVSEMILGITGLIIGLIIAALVTQPLGTWGGPIFGSIVGTVLQLFIYIVCGYLGVKISTRKSEDIKIAIDNLNLKRKDSKEIEEMDKRSRPKIMDTSVIIDGRIADISRTGFLEGPLIVPEFVLNELQHIADSSDDLKRKRGRRGLDILHGMQKEDNIEIIIYDEPLDDIDEVDSKLLKLTQILNGEILTNDYNLNKVASVQNIDVLNVNDLANAVKPVVLPGEEMKVEVVRDGKEAGQGLAYLDDGTMIVVESGRKYIGKNINVVVTSVLQTSAGKMIFGRPKNA